MKEENECLCCEGRCDCEHGCHHIHDTDSGEENKLTKQSETINGKR